MLTKFAIALLRVVINLTMVVFAWSAVHAGAGLYMVASGRLAPDDPIFVDYATGPIWLNASVMGASALVVAGTYFADRWAKAWQFRRPSERL